MYDKALYHDARIYTMDPRCPRASAMAVAGGRIMAVGTREEAEAALCGRYQSVDLRGLAVVPGFVDCHIHFVWYALGARRLNLDGVTSIGDIVRIVAERAAHSRPGEWILGHGWNRSIWRDAGVPTREQLDAASPAHPVALTSKDGHSMWVNSAALAAARVSGSTADPEGGRIERDARTGEPTGLLRENAQALVDRVIPAPSPSTCEEAVAAAIPRMHELGVVGIHDCEDDLAFRTFQTMAARRGLGLRVYMMIPRSNLDHAIELGLQTGFGDAYLRIGPLKVFADGALGSQSAALLEPYLTNPDSTGILTASPDELVDVISRASGAGIAVAVHAIGDRANRMVLDAFESVAQRSSDGTASHPVPESGSWDTIDAAMGAASQTHAWTPAPQAAAASTGVAGAANPAPAGTLHSERLRHRIEHAQLIHPNDMRRFAALAIIASVQPVHATSDRYMADLHWGKRASLAYAYRSLAAAGARLAFGSDAPVEAPNPIEGIFAAVTRKRADEVLLPGWRTEECLTVEEAVRGYTLGAAYASGEEVLKGSIAPGKLADFVVLSQDVFAVRPDDIIHTQVLATILGGDVVFDRMGIAV
ncbi:MAG: amidohydrolase [Clostridia bacterium]